MNNFYRIFLLLMLGATGAFAQQSWQSVTFPTHAEMLKGFAVPPGQYAQTTTWGLEGPLSRESVARDLDAIHKQGIRSVSIEGGYGMKEPYLSPGYFEIVKIIVEELKKRGMHLWIIDEGKYPSGFAGGLISQKSPELRMQAIVVSKRITLADNEKITNQPLTPQTLSAVAVNNTTRENKIIDISSGTLNWPGAPGNWQIILVDHRYKTSVTMAANNPARKKDTTNSLIDYLDPAATRKFMEYTHEQYKKYIGSEFGKTVLGFRGDEPEYNFTPWTPQLLNIFKQRKGYDIAPYLAAFTTQQLTDEQKLAKADFFDVWSDLFRDSFFKVQADWCKANNLEYMVHIDHEDMLMSLVRAEGDYFKDMRYVQIPGVDAIWHQIWYDNVADFPKIASSAAHMFGKPRAMSESFAAYRPKPTVADARWVINEELVRGINLFEYMFWPSSANGGNGPGNSYLGDTAFVKVSTYSNRASWLLANGIPQARVGVYCPTETMWTGNKMADSTLRMVSKLLLEHQVDFDFVDRQGLASVFKLQGSSFVNLSGQKYTAILIPTADVINNDVLARLKAFAQAGGKVIFMGDVPAKVASANFLKAASMPATGWASRDSWLNPTSALFAKLPHDVKLNKTAPDVKYQHRLWKNADLYFFFNEGKEAQDLSVTLNGIGKAVLWDANTGKTQPVARAVKKGTQTQLRLKLDAFETKFIVIQR